MTYHVKTAEAANGKWRGVLLELGVPAQSLTRRHAPCPMCGGTDRFRFDNKEGRGTWICNQCGAGDGMDLAIRYTGREFRDLAALIDGIVNNVKTEAFKPAMTEEQRLAKLRKVAAETVKLTPGCLADAYLRSRKLGETTYPKALRFGASILDDEGGVRPAMVATVQAPDGSNATLHRTFLRPDGGGKAEMDRPRKFMPGDIPDGAAVRLSEYTGGPLGIAEGIESALSAGHRYELPVWAALNATLLAKWQPPEGCMEVAIMADNDDNFTGQAAAYRLANRLRLKGLTVTVHVPPIIGEDWADVWMREAKA